MWIRVWVVSCLVWCLVHGWYSIINIRMLKCHASLLSSSLLESSLYVGVNEIISFQQLVKHLDNMTITNLGRQHHRSSDSYSKSSWECWYCFWSYKCQISHHLKFVPHIFELISLTFAYSLNKNTETLQHLWLEWDADDTSILQHFLCVSQTCPTKRGENSNQNTLK